ncbi:MAG: helix-turn-helix transcriptional regulator [Negativicutes bacterium]|nr:helix-turn-helix transcriptional regulator [Negativicutes bacterium]
MMMTYLILAQVIKIRSLRNKKATLLACSLVLSLDPFLIGLCPLGAAEYASPAVAIGLATVSGAALAIFLAAWQETVAVNTLRKNSVTVGMGLALASSITILGQFLPYYWSLSLLILSPPLSLAILLRQSPDEISQFDDYQRIDAVRLFPLKLILAISIFYVTGGIMLSIIDLEQSYPYIFHLTYLCYALFCPLMGYILYRYENIDLRLIYQIIFTLALTGFLLFSFRARTMAIAALISLQCGSALLNLYTWLLFAYFARFSTRPAAVCAFGQFVALFSYLSGDMIVNLLSSTLRHVQITRDLAFIACVALASVVFLFPDKKETFSGWRPVVEPVPLAPAGQQPLLTPNEPQTADGLDWHDDLPLSAREKDVLTLLLKGRSGSYISEFLNISSNTVKFHTRNIYGKLFVSNRQELLTLFEQKRM